MMMTEDNEQPDILTYLKYTSNQRSEKMLEKYNELAAEKGQSSARKSRLKKASPKKSIKNQQRKIKDIETLTSMKKVKMT